MDKEYFKKEPSNKEAILEQGTEYKTEECFNNCPHIEAGDTTGSKIISSVPSFVSSHHVADLQLVYNDQSNIDAEKNKVLAIPLVSESQSECNRKIDQASHNDDEHNSVEFVESAGANLVSQNVSGKVMITSKPDQIPQTNKEKKSSEVSLDCKQDNHTAVIKIVKMENQNKEEIDGTNTVISSEGSIVLDESLLGAILLATSNEGQSDISYSTIVNEIEDTNHTECTRYEDSDQTIITIVTDTNENEKLELPVNEVSDFSVAHVSEESQPVLDESQLYRPICIYVPGKNVMNTKAINSVQGNDSIDEYASISVRSMLPNTTLENLSKSDHRSDKTPTMTNYKDVPIMKSKGVQAAEISIHCDICKKYYKKAYFKSHYLLHIGEKKFTCKICNKSFMTAQHLRRHEVVHTKAKPYPCTLCGNSYTQSSHLRIHMRKHNQEKNYICSTCGKCFYQSQNLKRHLISHISDRPYKCSLCDKTFKFKDHLVDHERTHSEEPLFKCDICNYPCKTRSTLFTHRITHFPERMAKYKRFQNSEGKIGKKKKFRCEKCQRSFIKEDNLNIHQCRKSEFFCDICNRQFLLRLSLLRHKCKKAITNNLKRIHSCLTCGEQFFSEHLLHEHQLYAHISNTNFTCEICGYKILQNKVSSHLELHVGKMGTYRCHLCDEEFSSTAILKQHMSKHSGECDADQEKSSFRCNICAKTFKSERHLASHLNIHSGEEKNFNCHICKQEFDMGTDLSEHLKNHKEDNFAIPKILEKEKIICDLCNKAFSRKSAFKKHLKLHKGKEKLYKCHLCSEEFEKSSACHEHTIQKKCFMAIKRYVCKFCEKGYEKHPYLVEHIKGHIIGGGFRCIECSQEFENEDELKKHCKAHVGTTTSHECRLCKRVFNYKVSLKKHMERHAGSDKLYKCTECPEEFDEEKSLYKHVKEFHQIYLIIQDDIIGKEDSTKPSCDICGKYFKDQWRLKRHIQSFKGKIKKYRCHKCPKEYDSAADTKSHMAEMHVDTYVQSQKSKRKCNICEKVFKNDKTFNMHQKTHQGDNKKYRCKCSSEFEESFDLKCHIKENLVIVGQPVDKELDGMDANCFLKCTAGQNLLKFCSEDGFDYDGYIKNKDQMMLDETQSLELIHTDNFEFDEFYCNDRSEVFKSVHTKISPARKKVRNLDSIKSEKHLMTKERIELPNLNQSSRNVNVAPKNKCLNSDGKVSLFDREVKRKSLVKGIPKKVLNAKESTIKIDEGNVKQIRNNKSLSIQISGDCHYRTRKPSKRSYPHEYYVQNVKHLGKNSTSEKEKQSQSKPVQTIQNKIDDGFEGSVRRSTRKSKKLYTCRY